MKRIKNYLVLWLYRWLPIIFGCHQMPSRSFYFKKRQFPICARCTGELIGILISPLIFLILKSMCLNLSYILCIILLIPMVIDGTSQYIGLRVSNNSLRLITGLLFGLGISFVVFLTTKDAFQFGKSLYL